MGKKTCIFWGILLLFALVRVHFWGENRAKEDFACFQGTLGQIEGVLRFRRPGVWTLEREGDAGSDTLYWEGPPSWEGRRVQVRGKVKCRTRYRNPHLRRGSRRRFLSGSVRAVAPEAPAPRGLAGAPAVTQWVRAVWLGRGEGLDPALWEGARQWGILPVLVQSGQHVWVAVAGLALILGRGARFGVVGILLVLSGSVALWRIAVVLLARSLLRWRGLNVSPVQALSSTFALHWLVEVSPGPGFFLTYLGTWALMTGSLFTVSVVLFPVLAAHFGVLPLAVPLALALVGWVWNWVVIPVGFLAPVFGPAVMRWVEVAWKGWVDLHQWVEAPMAAVRLPGVGEQIFLVGLLLWVTSKRSKALG